VKKAGTLLAFACAFSTAAAPAAGQEAAQPPATTDEATTVAGETAPAAPARPASARLKRAYQRWHRTLGRHDLWRGRNLLHAARREEGPPPAARELREAIHRMRLRFHRFLRSPRGRAVRFAAKVRKVPEWGRSHLRRIAWCESRHRPGAIGGGGTFRGLYQFTFRTWRVMGGSGDPAAAPRSEQTWRAWLLLRRHGPRHWPVCG
jgi:hypothetical protein